MPLFGKKAKGKTTKLFFVTDVHGSQTTFRKFVNAGKFYEVDVLVLGGDIAGKMVVPILDLGGGKYRATIQSITHELDGSGRGRRLREAGRQARLLHGGRDQRRVQGAGRRPVAGGRPLPPAGDRADGAVDRVRRGAAGRHRHPLLHHRRQRRLAGHPGAARSSTTARA